MKKTLEFDLGVKRIDNHSVEYTVLYKGLPIGILILETPYQDSTLISYSMLLYRTKGERN